MKLYEKMPNVVKSVLYLSHGWLVGSAGRNLIENRITRDFDIICAPEYYGSAVTYLKSMTDTYTINSFGGLKFTVEENTLTHEIDIWVDSLDHFLATASKSDVSYNMRINKLLVNGTD